MIALDFVTIASTCQIIMAGVIPVVIYGWRKLKAEMSPNHGSSMRDAIDRIEKEIKRNRKDIRRLTQELESHLSYFDGE